jgi:hypothetical protein
MPIATTNVDDLKKHQEQERLLKEKVNNVEHIDLKKVITIEDVLMKKRKENLENVVVESDLEQIDSKNESVLPKEMVVDSGADAWNKSMFTEKELDRLRELVKEIMVPMIKEAMKTVKPARKRSKSKKKEEIKELKKKE